MSISRFKPNLLTKGGKIACGATTLVHANKIPILHGEVFWAVSILYYKLCHVNNSTQLCHRTSLHGLLNAVVNSSLLFICIDGSFFCYLELKQKLFFKQS